MKCRNEESVCKDSKIKDTQGVRTRATTSKNQYERTRSEFKERQHEGIAIPNKILIVYIAIMVAFLMILMFSLLIPLLCYNSQLKKENKALIEENRLLEQKIENYNISFQGENEELLDYSYSVGVAGLYTTVKIGIMNMYEDEEITDSQYKEFLDLYEETFLVKAEIRKVYDVKELNEMIKDIYGDLSFLEGINEEKIDIEGISDGSLFWEGDYIVYQMYILDLISTEEYQKYSDQKEMVLKELTPEKMSDILEYIKELLLNESGMPLEYTLKVEDNAVL